MYLVDTNVLSEVRKGVKANPGVKRFWLEVDDADLYLSVVTIGELRRGIENLRYRGDLSQAKRLEDWLSLVGQSYANRLLTFDEECAQVWGMLMSPNNQHAIDKQIAATALIHDLTVVTRNTDDFVATGVRLHNPFE